VVLSKAGIPSAPRQQRIVDHLLEKFDGKLVKQDRDLFSYVGTHWKLFTPGDHDKLRVLVQKTCQGNADAKHVNATYQLLMYHIPSPPENVDMFTPHPFCANFLNGTLHLRKDAKKYTTEFKPHRALDYLVTVLPYEYEPDATKRPKNQEFLGMLERVFDGDHDKGEKIRAVRQMYGACLLPAFPRLFMLHGVPGTGKSTVINVACRLVHSDNLCSVPPSEWHGFNMESMANKLVNADTDIPLNSPLDDAMVKKIIERKPFRLRRKGIKDIMAPIPSVHMFGGNGIPNTLDGASRAHTRRWTFLGFNAFVPKGEYDQEYWDYCFEQSPEGVLAFALEGLDDLNAHGGHFVNPRSGQEDIERWQMSTDPVGQFLAEVDQGEILDGNSRWERGLGCRVERKKAWCIFKAACEENTGKPVSVSKFAFFDILRKKGFEEYRSHGVVYYRGIGVKEDGAGAF
jgi:phage/plasmid-associated DNA primase